MKKKVKRTILYLLHHLFSLNEAPWENKIENADKVVCIRPDNLGDLILTLPAILYLKEKGIHPVVFGKREYSEAGTLTNTEYRSFNLPFFGSQDGFIRALKNLADFQPKIAIDFVGDFRTLLLLKLFGYKIVSYPLIKTVNSYHKYFPMEHVSVSALRLAAKAIGSELHFKWPVIDNYCLITEKFRMYAPSDYQNYLEFTEYLKKQVARYKAKGYVIFYPYANKVKAWPVEYFCELIRIIEKKLNLIVVVMGTKNERVLLKTFGNTSKKAVVFCGSLFSFLLLILKARLFLSADTGPMHLAALTPTPQIALFGPTFPELYGPIFKSNSIILRPKIQCSSCFRPGFNYYCSYSYCMKSISPYFVFEILKKLLK